MVTYLVKHTDNLTILPFTVTVGVFLHPKNSTVWIRFKEHLESLYNTDGFGPNRELHLSDGVAQLA
jgi:hypothetical protein